MSDVGIAVGFWGLGALAVVSALGIVLTRNLLHAVLWLVLSFVAVAGLFLTLSADFVAVAQVLIYAGAISVLMVFGVMLTPSSARVNADTSFFGPGFVLGGLVAAVMAFVAFKVPWAETDNGGFTTTVNLIGEALLNRWALPFEIASVLLIVAMIGAIVLVRASEPLEPLTVDEPAPFITEDDAHPERGLIASGTTVERVPVTNPGRIDDRPAPHGG
jgi:NADH-quinone oxidoreductase subunit J